MLRSYRYPSQFQNSVIVKICQSRLIQLPLSDTTIHNNLIQLYIGARSVSCLERS
jgi:hypothetical protein